MSFFADHYSDLKELEKTKKTEKKPEFQKLIHPRANRKPREGEDE